MSRFPDPVRALRSYLATDDDIDTITQGRIYAPGIPKTQSEHMPRKCLVLTRAGGPRDSGRARWTSIRLDMKSYGETGEDASDVDLTAHSVMKGLKRTSIENCILFSAVVSGGPIDLLDPDTDWPYVQRTYELQVGE